MSNHREPAQQELDALKEVLSQVLPKIDTAGMTALAVECARAVKAAFEEAQKA